MYILQCVCLEHFRSISLFIGGNVRPAVNAGTADCIPIFLHEIPRLFKEGYLKPDISLIHVSPPDDKGFCSLGTSVDSVRSAVSHSKRIIGKSRKNLPNTYVLLQMEAEFKEKLIFHSFSQ